MSIFDELRQAVMLQHEESDLPECLVVELLEIVESPSRYAGREPLVQRLIEQVRDYDPYAGAGCFSDACSLEDIRRTLRQLEA